MESEERVEEVVVGSTSSSAPGRADDEEEVSSSDSNTTESSLRSFLARLRQMSFQCVVPDPEIQLHHSPRLSSFDLEGVAALIKSGKAKKIICMCGAGISVNAGIPDFRTPGTGLYSQLEKYNLPKPEAVFSIDFFRQNPKPFFTLAKELFPGSFQPTATHYFMKLLHSKGRLLRCFTQNIDSLESQAGLPPESIVAAHGNFDTARCIACRQDHPLSHVREAVFSDQICRCTRCGSLVKPDIVFFGEALPERFHQLRERDMPQCDLLIVLGTSLVVQPFASLMHDVDENCPRLLINREKVGEAQPSLFAGLPFTSSFGFDFSESNYRDALFLGDCDAGVRQLAGLLGWGQELEELCQKATSMRAHCGGLSRAGSAPTEKLEVAEKEDQEPMIPRAYAPVNEL